MSFKDKYKGKAETVQRDGSNAMLVSTSGPSRRLSRNSNGSVSGSAAPSSSTQQQQQPSRATPHQQQQQQPPHQVPPLQPQFNSGMFQAPPPMVNPYMQQPPGTLSPYPQQQQPMYPTNTTPYSQQPIPQLTGQHDYVQRQAQHAGADGASGLSQLITPQGAVGRENPYARSRARAPQQQPQQQQQQPQLPVAPHRTTSPSVQDLTHTREHGHVSPPRDGRPVFNSVAAMKASLQQHEIPPLDQSPSPTSMGRVTKKPPVPDFTYQPPVVQHGRRAGQAPHEMPPIIGNYKPHTLNEYKKLQSDIAHQRWGGLGADDNDEKQAAREKRAKIFNYGRSVNSVNFAMMEVSQERASKPPGRGLDEKGKIGKMKRERALKYGMEHGYSPKRMHVKAKTPDPCIDTTLDQQLNELEQKQRRDQDRIAEIKRALGLVVAEEAYDYDD